MNDFEIKQAITQTYDPVTGAIVPSPTTELELPVADPSATIAASPAVTELPATQARPNFNVTVQYTSEVNSDTAPADDVTVMPSGSSAQVRQALRKTPNIKTTLDKATQKYLSVINAALDSLPFAGAMTAVAEREGGQWEQTVTSKAGNLALYTPRFRHTPGVKATGDTARSLIRNKMKLGTVVSIPLWHSGFWITLRSPSEGDLLELYRKITQEKMSLGRTTYGLLYSNITTYTSKALLDFVVENLHATSLALPQGGDIRNHIRLPDLSLVIWGLACSTWPNGFQYQRACITDVDKCKHIITEKLNLARLLWTDTTSLTDKQIQHMTHRDIGSVTVDQANQYVIEFMRGINTKVKIADGLNFVLTIPTASQHIDAGYRWINQIEETYGRAMTVDADRRAEYLLSQAQATSMRQYAHCVASVIVDDEEIDGLEEIENALNDLTARDDIRDSFMEQVAKFLDDSVVAFVAIPTYTCPACGGHQHPTHTTSKHPELIPLDVAQTFFPLLVQKVLRIQDR